MNSLLLLQEIVRRGRPPAATNKKIEENLRKSLSAAIVFLSLDDAQAFGGGGVTALGAHISVMGQPDLKKLLKKWDPHRKFTSDTTITEMRDVATALLNAEIPPAVRPPPAPRRRARAP
jgi:hypothetical protein